MIKWIKNLFVSKRLGAANKRIQELETEVSSLKSKIAYLEDTFIPEIPKEVLIKQYAADRTLLFVKPLKEYIQKVFRLLKLTFNKSKLA